MVLDAVAFDIVELEVLQGIDQGGVAMGEAMPLVFAVIPVVPVVQEVIVQEGRANQGFEVDAVPQVCAVGHPHSQAGDTHGMFERGDAAVLVAAAFDLHVAMLDDLTAMLGDQALNLRSGEQMSHDFRSFPFWVGSVQSPVVNYDYPAIFKNPSSNTVTDCRAQICPCTLIQKNDNGNR